MKNFVPKITSSQQERKGTAIGKELAGLLSCSLVDQPIKIDVSYTGTLGYFFDVAA
jgi:hypothetical protein